MAALYWLAADRLARRVCRRFPVGDGWGAALAAALAASAVAAVFGVMLCDLWSGAIESLRVGSGHPAFALVPQLSIIGDMDYASRTS